MSASKVVAVVGSSGAVGQEIINLLASRNFLENRIYPPTLFTLKKLDYPSKQNYSDESWIIHRNKFTLQKLDYPSNFRVKLSIML